MQINGIDISTYGFKYLRREIASPQIAVYGNEWLKNAHKPILGDKRARYLPIAVTLLHDGTAHEYETVKSVLLDKLAQCTIKFDDLEFFFDVSLNSSETQKFNSQEFREFTVALDAYSKYQAEIIEEANRVPSKTIDVPGNMETPVIIEITPSINLIDLTVAGLGDEFKLSNLIAGNTIVLNGEDCTVLQGGDNKFADFDGWGFPKLKPGSNELTFSQSSCDITIRYKPRWL